MTDANGNTNLVDGTPITLTVASGDSLFGTTTRNTTQGVATFDDILLKVAGQKTLVAASLGLSGNNKQCVPQSHPGPLHGLSLRLRPVAQDPCWRRRQLLQGARLRPTRSHVMPTTTLSPTHRRVRGHFKTSAAVSSPGDLTPAADKRSARFSGKAAGSTVSCGIGVRPLVWFLSGVFTVTAGSQYAKVLVETAADGSGTQLGDKTLAAGGTVIVYAIAKDSARRLWEMSLLRHGRCREAPPAGSFSRTSLRLPIRKTRLSRHISLDRPDSRLRPGELQAMKPAYDHGNCRGS